MTFMMKSWHLLLLTLITMNPDGPWMQQIARNLTAFDDGALVGKKYLLMDRDTKFCEAFRGIVENEGTGCVLLPPKSPNLNANIERFMRSIKEECLSKLIFFGEASLRKAVSEYLVYYHAERNHQGLENQLIEPGAQVGAAVGAVDCRERLGGILRYYHRKAA